MSKPDYRTPANVRKIYRRLQKHFGPATPPLDFETNEQLAIAVVLSAQCTDERVNIVTKDLFKYYPDMASLAKAPLERIKKLIYSTGFYNNKAKNIKALAKALVKDYDGKIPDDFDVLVKLPGIGRKTANVVANQAFDKAYGIVVDTHVKRVANRLGLTDMNTPEKIERDLMSYVPEKLWKDFSLYIIFHGRKFCDARKPRCEECLLADSCRMYATAGKG